MHTRLTLWTRLSVLISVFAVAAACGGSSGGTAAAGTLPDTISGLQVLAAGGEGTSGDGGDGGSFDIEAYTGGNIEVRRVGSVDTSFTVPSVNPTLGDNPLTVSADVVLTPSPSNRLIGDDGTNAATGLRVLPGITLTLRGNHNTDGNPATMERAYLQFDQGVVIEGTLTGYADQLALGDGLSLDAVDLRLRADNVVIRPTAKILFFGKDAAPGMDGGDGGNLDFDLQGTVIVRAPMDASGGDGDNGGDGGYLDWYISSEGALYTTGNIDLSGGFGANGTGGDGGYYDTHIHEGPQKNSGDLSTRGGDGTLGGGDAGYMYFYNCDPGLLVNSGNLEASGGNATVNGPGGDADYIEFYYYAGPLRMTGSYRARGGDGAGSGDGGDGGDFEVYGYEYDLEDTDFAYGFVLAADLDLRGGMGRDGGDGGDVTLEVEFDESHNPDQADLHSLYIVGYDRIVTAGARGSVNGGSGGYVDLEMEYGNNYDIEYIGSVFNEAEIVTRGGDGVTGAGGGGGDIDMTTYDDATFHFDRQLLNTGALDACGGSGGTTGGGAGDVYFYEYVRTENTGTILALGGAGGTGAGGDGGTVEILGDNVVLNRAPITADGGASVSGAGGDGEDIYVFGQAATCIGAVSSCGGASNTSAGGNAGEIEIGSTLGPSTITGSCNVAPGTGAPDGKTGEVWLDGVNCALTNGLVLMP